MSVAVTDVELVDVHALILGKVWQRASP